MSNIYEDLPKKPPMSRVWAGVIHSNPTDLEARVDVVIPDFDNTLVFEKCMWQARSNTALPTRGDRCLVIFDNNREAWVVAWWPF